MAEITKPMLLDETGKQIVTELQNVVKALQGDTPTPQPSYTGHVDVEGLKAIGWDDNDIAQLKVCWNEEQDEAFKVTDYDKWYYDYLKTQFGEDLIVTDDNKANLLTTEARSCIHFMPKVNTSSVTSMGYMFQTCNSLVSVPQFDTSSVKTMGNMFYSCYSLVSVPQFNTSVTSMSSMFQSCYSLVSVGIGIKYANILSDTQKSLNGQSFIDIIERANNTSAISQTLYMNAVAAKKLYELSCNIDESKTWMTKNDGSQSAQTWLAAQARRTDKAHSNYAITLSFTSGSSDYSGQ